jgi:glycosyltransferase involved in cell wall biosynthesis
MNNILTIITICKNQPFIRETCESVVSQIDKDFEWIVVD